MLRRDYLVRMIEEMTEMIGKIFNLKQQRKTIEALWELDEWYQRQFRLNSSLLRSLSAIDIVELFRSGGILEGDQLQSLARMLREEGDVYLISGELDEGIIRHMKALHLYLAALLNGADRKLWNIDGEIRELLGLLQGYRLPNDTERLLLQYEEEQGRFDLAENALFRLLKSGGLTKIEATTFYERLLEYDASMLEQGGLPLVEVREGLEEVLKGYDE